MGSLTGCISKLGVLLQAGWRWIPGRNFRSLNLEFVIIILLMFWLICPFPSILLRPRNTLAAAGSCKTWFTRYYQRLCWNIPVGCEYWCGNVWIDWAVSFHQDEDEKLVDDVEPNENRPHAHHKRHQERSDEGTWKWKKRIWFDYSLYYKVNWFT